MRGVGGQGVDRLWVLGSRRKEEALCQVLRLGGR